MGRVHEKRAKAARNAKKAGVGRGNGLTEEGRQVLSEASKSRHEVRRLEQLKADRERAEAVNNTDAVPCWIKAELLKGDQETCPYQRVPDQRRIDKMAQDFDPDAIGTVYVSQREDGTYAVIDGWHRVLLMRQVGWGDQQMQASLYTGLSIQDEARLFHFFNFERRQPSAFANYTAKLIEGDPSYLAMQEVLDKYDVTVGPSNAHRVLRAPVVAKANFDKGGAEVFDKTIGTLLEAWPENSNALARNLVDGLGLLLWAERDNPTIDLKSMAKKLGTYEPEWFINQAKDVKRHFDYLASGAMAHAIAQAYNKGRTRHRLTIPLPYQGWPNLRSDGSLVGNGWGGFNGDGRER